MSRALPSLISVTTIAPDGSRRSVHPADVRGRYTLWRRLVALVLLAIYILLPWIPVNGSPAVFLDVASRRFHLMGIVLAAEDLWLGFFLVTGLAFSLFYVSALFGRVWCGWTCPYTVFLEHVFRRVERLIDGDSASRRRLEEAGWSVAKITRRVVKHGIYLVLSAFIAHVFLSYFVSLPQLYAWMQGPPSQHWLAFGVVVFLTGTLYFAFSWFREQFCIILCPYGRLQSALTDDHTLNVGYDQVRGEPRGKVNAAGAGDCINCQRCVQVCPTGIDIRNGLQLECIGCAACVDACDEIMTRVGRKPGLIRHDSQAAFQGGLTRFIRPRIILYSLLLACGMLVSGFSLLAVRPAGISLNRLTGAPYFVNSGEIRNQFQVRLVNKRTESAVFRFALGPDTPGELRLTGAEDAVIVPRLGEVVKTVVLAMPAARFKGALKVKLQVSMNSDPSRPLERELEFLGPDPRLHNDDYLNPQNYLR
ncbi:MAG: cytochrome c oxidase accessory protein CcoG [Verrucomicrobium sp.]